MTPPWCQEVIERLELLRELAASGDGEPLAYTPEPPLPEAAIEAFETSHGLTLPADYRDFVLLVGNGGFGPDFGIAPLADCEPPHQGAMEIGEIGGGSFIRLTVRGPTRGQILRDGEGVLVPVAPSFRDWIEQWLEHALADELGNAARSALMRRQAGPASDDAPVDAIARGAELVRERACSDEGAAAALAYALLYLGRRSKAAEIVARLHASETGRRWSHDLHRYLSDD